MSVKNELSELKRVLGPAMGPMIKGALLFQSGDILEVLSEIHLERGAFPEPFDVASHIGNSREGAMMTMAAYAGIGIFTLWQPMLIDRSPEVIKKRAKWAAVGAFAISTAVQLVAEKFGITNSLVEHNTADMLDAAYGIGWSAAVALGAHRLLINTEQAHHERMEALEQAHDASLQTFIATREQLPVPNESNQEQPQT
jgi:hypothetical protein